MTASDKLDEAACNELLRMVRATLECYLETRAIPEFHTTRPDLLSRRGVFVTLHRGEELRGCIGQITADRELFRIVQKCAIGAAVQDTRFRRVTREELDALTIEISVLTPMRRVEDIGGIEVGRHGLFIIRGRHRGLLLPQVPGQYGWDRETFLAQTCRKAGLGKTAWKEPGTEIQCFEAQVFSEQG